MAIRSYFCDCKSYRCPDGVLVGRINLYEYETLGNLPQIASLWGFAEKLLYCSKSVEYFKLQIWEHKVCPRNDLCRILCGRELQPCR